MKNWFLNIIYKKKQKEEETRRTTFISTLSSEFTVTEELADDLNLYKYLLINYKVQYDYENKTFNCIKLY
jgi:hypothetical protein